MPTLEATNLNVRFGEHHAVRDVDVSVDTGQIVGLIGPNGAGKTTTFNAISGVRRCTGTVRIDGTDVSRAAPHERARHGMSRTFQRLEVFGTMTGVGPANSRPGARASLSCYSCPTTSERHRS